MKINDKCKELADFWIEVGKVYEDMNKELEKPNPDVYVFDELLTKRKKMDNKHATLLKEFQTIMNKTSDDLRLKVARVWGKPEK